MMITYKSAMFFNYLNMVMNLAIFFFFASMFGIENLEALEGYGGDVISYVVLGSMGWAFLWTIMDSASNSMMQEMKIGTFEVILLTPTSPVFVVMAYTVWGILMSAVGIILVLVTSVIIFDVVINANFVLTFIVLLICIGMMSGFGLMVGGLNVHVKQTGAVVEVIQRISYFLCGVVFPISVLPGALQSFSTFLPFYHALHTLRLTLSVNPPLEILISQILLLCILAAGSIMVGVFTFRMGLKKARKEGTLAFY
ncbi:MAG: ABC transporter permease [Theionarchaea archaeon]|nr:ABC transporter permease [Theionarchaea archaeon]